MQELDQIENNRNTVLDTADLAAPKEDALVAKVAQNDFVVKIIEKIKASENILIALSKTPTVDDFAAAVGLTLFLDSMQHHVTAVYSGEVPEALNFLRIKELFETNVDSLQDFIIALNKEKADHLRYKLEGDEVRVYITPYRTTITEKDLTFTHGDYNVDFVIAINVKEAQALDPALSNYSRIMHAASAVNITCEQAGRFGEIEWSNMTASSVSEMVTELIMAMQGANATIDNEVATALLTGIMAATERFSNRKTNADTLSVASKLMAMGADQATIATSLTALLQPGAAAQPAVDPRAHGSPAASGATGQGVTTGGVVAEGTAVEGAAEPKLPAVNPIVAANIGAPGGIEAEAPEMPPAVQGNPAAQVAQGMTVAEGPAPVAMATAQGVSTEEPELPPTTMTARSEARQGSPDAQLAAQMPIVMDGAILTPVVGKPQDPSVMQLPVAPKIETKGAAMPAAPVGVAVPGAPGTPVMAGALGAGLTMQTKNLTPTGETLEKNYGQMLADALKEPTPITAPPQVLATQGVLLAAQEAEMEPKLPKVQEPEVNENMEGAESVERPEAPVLPPPPTPPMPPGMMPPQ